MREAQGTGGHTGWRLREREEGKKKEGKERRKGDENQRATVVSQGRDAVYPCCLLVLSKASLFLNLPVRSLGDELFAVEATRILVRHDLVARGRTLLGRDRTPTHTEKRRTQEETTENTHVSTQ